MGGIGAAQNINPITGKLDSNRHRYVALRVDQQGSGELDASEKHINERDDVH